MNKTTITNANGTTYNVLSYTETECGNAYLLSQTTEGGHVLQYIVARNWSEKTHCWDCGHYFVAFYNPDEARANAEDVYLQTVSALLYGV